MKSIIKPLFCGASVLFAGYLIDVLKIPDVIVVSIVALFNYALGEF